MPNTIGLTKALLGLEVVQVVVIVIACLLLAYAAYLVLKGR